MTNIYILSEIYLCFLRSVFIGGQKENIKNVVAMYTTRNMN